MNYIVKLAYFVLVSCFLSTTVYAQQTDLAEKVKICSKISANQARLSCFDELTIKQEPKAQVPKAAASQAALTTEQVNSFSKVHLKKTKEELAKEIDQITLVVSKVKKNAYGKLLITFTNGQEWQQRDSNRMRLSTGATVTLHKGAFSSVFLQKENGNKRIKVKRLK